MLKNVSQLHPCMQAEKLLLSTVTFFHIFKITDFKASFSERIGLPFPPFLYVMPGISQNRKP